MGFEPMKSVSRTCAPHYMQAFICVRATGLPPHLGHRVRTRALLLLPQPPVSGKRTEYKLPHSPLFAPLLEWGDVCLTYAHRLLLSGICVWLGPPQTYLSDAYYVPGPMSPASLIVSHSSPSNRYCCSHLQVRKLRLREVNDLPKLNS